jgi:hypothetical protein
MLGILGILGDVGRLAAAVGIDLKDAFSLFEHFNPGQVRTTPDAHAGNSPDD